MDKEHCEWLESVNWDEKEFNWKNKPFFVTKYKEFMHMPLNYGKVLAKALEKIGDRREDQFTLSGEESLLSSSLLVPVTEEGNFPVEKISGTVLTRLFEGNYSDIKSWIKEMTNYVRGKDKEVKKFWFWYPTCPKCAKKYGKVQTVIFAQVQ
ncbi:MAG: hypothetical protein PHG51_07815 [Candidatus Omnitrophica bacterium]|nr:hypothetical protein [Candidatus Omnitrophota bacterium]